MLNRFPIAWINSMLLLLLSVLSFAVRIGYAGTYAESWDAVDFALALERYDILEMQPHFPGYPVYILLAHLFLTLTHQPVVALTWLSALFGSLSLVLFYLIASRLLSGGLAVWAATLLFFVSPLLALTHVQPMSEAFGLFAVLLLTMVIAVTLNRSGAPLFWVTCAGVVLFALLLGIRTSYFPIGFLLLHPLWRLYLVRTSITTFFLHCSVIGLLFFVSLAAWLLPTAATEGGLGPYFALGKAFTVGHFTDWGGTSFAGDISWWDRAFAFIWERLFLNGLLGTATLAGTGSLTVWITQLIAMFLPILLVSGLLLRQNKRHGQKERWFILLAVLPYTLWVFFGQNSEKARHILPLLPWLYLLLAHNLGLLWQRREKLWRFTLIAVYLLTLCGFGVRQWEVLQQHLLPPPALQMIWYTEQYYPTDNTLIYTWEEERLFHFYAPDFQTERLRSYSYFIQSIQVRSGTVAHVLLTNAVLDGFGPDHPLRHHVRELARFSADPLLYPTYHRVILYEIPQDTLERLISETL